MSTNKLVIGLIGLPGCGKTTIADMLIEADYLKLINKQLSATKISIGSILSKTLSEYYVESTRANLQRFGSLIYEMNPNGISSIVTEKIIKLSEQIIIFDPIRTKDDYKMFTKFSNHIFIHVITDVDTLRYKRMRQRNSKSGENSRTDTEFCEEETHPIESGIHVLSPKADYVIQNNKTIDFLKETIDCHIKQFLTDGYY